MLEFNVLNFACLQIFLSDIRVLFLVLKVIFSGCWSFIIVV